MKADEEKRSRSAKQKPKGRASRPACSWIRVDSLSEAKGNARRATQEGAMRNNYTESRTGRTEHVGELIGKFKPNRGKPPEGARKGDPRVESGRTRRRAISASSEPGATLK